MELSKKNFFKFYLSNPLRIFQQLKYKNFLKSNPGVPWMAPDVIKFLDKNITKEFQVLEWGSGGSTKWFAQRCGNLMSVENNEGWYNRVKEELGQENISNVDYRLFKSDDSNFDQEEALKQNNIPDYVKVINEFEKNSLDLVIVDGAFRHICVQFALERIKPGGYLLIDNSNWCSKEDWGVPAVWKEVSHDDWGVACTTVWQKPL